MLGCSTHLNDLAGFQKKAVTIPKIWYPREIDKKAGACHADKSLPTPPPGIEVERNPVDSRVGLKAAAFNGFQASLHQNRK